MTAINTMRNHAKGNTHVKSYELTPFDEPVEGPPLVRLHLVEDFSGDIVGEGVAEGLQVSIGKAAASFVGLERVSGTVGGRQGSFVLQAQGTWKGDTVSATWFVLPGSGTGDLQGIRGEGGFQGVRGQGPAEIMLDYWYEVTGTPGA